MIPRVRRFIISVLENEIFKMLNKSRKDFIISVLWHILSIKGRIDFLQLGRFSPLCEQTYRNQFEKEFDFYSFNKQLINKTVSAELAIAMNPSFIPKAGKSTYGRGRYWSGVAGAAKWGLDICGFAVVDIVNNTAFHLNAWQTPPSDELAEKGLNLLTYYASLVRENAEKFKGFSNYVLADAYFAKKPFVEALISADMHLISRLRDDSVLKFRFTGERTGKQGAALTAVNLAKHDWLSTKSNEDKPFSMSDYKTHYNNTLMQERFICVFAIDPNTAKNQKIFKELLNYGKIAA